MLTLRKHKISRLALLVLSTTVPRSYDQLIDLLKGLPAFACCFALLVWIWHEHASLFERYSLTDGLTILLNSVLLFVVLVYVNPLKFMFESFMGSSGWARGPMRSPRCAFTSWRTRRSSMAWDFSC